MMKINPIKQKYCKKIGYTIGSAGDVSYGEKYEFDTIEEMLVAHFNGI